MPDPIDAAIDTALGLATPASLAPDPLANVTVCRAIFDEHLRQQREILALQREAYDALLEKTRKEQKNVVALLEELGLIDLRAEI